MRNVNSGLVRFGAALVAALLGASCAQERPAINRVQANAMKKSFFVGPSLADPSDDPEFYMRGTVVDVPYGASQDGLFTATYAQPVSRIKWDIQEEMLTARLTYERVQDSDHKGARATKDGQVVASFRIQSHFDIKREYNPTSGEEMNVVGENTTDRPWYEREYFRVDWSQNLMTDAYDFDTVSQIGVYGGVKFAPMAYYIEDPNDPNHPEFDVEGGYFDITNKVWAAPGNVDIPGFGSFPACFIPMQWGGSYPIGNCNPTELTIRLAFRQIKDTDYEPTEWTATKMEMFGFFLQERYGYDRGYGVIDNKWHRFASRYNIWERSHIDGSVCATAQTTPPGKDPHRDLNKDGTEDECEAAAAALGAPPDSSRSSGSRCDELTHKCTLPLRNRTVKTQAFYYGPESSSEWFDSTGKAVEAWNQAMRNAVQSGRYAECMRTAGQLCGQMYRLDTEKLGTDRVANVFAWCHNPVAEGDDAVCGPAGRKVRVGDLRYHMVNIIPTPQTPSPWGIMVDADDPITGEKVAASVNEWGHILDIASQGTVDLVKFMAGELSADQIVDGVNVDAYFQEMHRTNGGMGAPTLSAAEMAKRLQSVNTQLSSQSGLTAAERRYPTAIKSKIAQANLISQGALGPGNSALQARFDALKGTQIEKLLVTPELMQGVGINPQAMIDDAVVARASPLRGGLNPTLGKQIRQMRELAFAQRGACVVEAPEPDGLMGLAKLMPKLFPPADPNRPDLVQAREQAMRHYIADLFNQGVLAHELGHSMGLRHNFTGSWDALNYHRPYWMLRTKNGTSPKCLAATADGSTCVGPRYLDPVTPEEDDNLIWRYASSTVMDYPGDQTQDFNLLGAYDKAAVRLAYGGTVDVWADLSLDSTDAVAVQKANNALGFLDGFPGLFGILDFPKGGPYIENHHYTEYQKLFNLIRYCGPATDANDPEALNGTACSGPNLDVVDFRDMSDAPKYGSELGALYPNTVAKAAKDPQGRVRHGYMYGSDEYADFGNTPVYRFDSGADHYEQAQYLINTYRNRYIFDYFRRNRTTFNTNGAVSRVMGRYLDKLAANMKTFGLYLTSADAQSLSSDGAAKPFAMAVSDIFNTFAQMLTMPEPGGYKQSPTANLGLNYYVADSLILGTTGNFSILPITGRWLHNDYDYAKGGIWWSEYQKQVGSYYEKIYAIYYMAEAYDNFVTNTKEDYVDGRYKNLNFASVFPDQTRRLFAQILTGDYKTFAPWVFSSAPSSANPPPVGVSYFDWTDSSAPLARPAGAKVVDPLVGWNEQLYSMIFGTMFFPTSWSQDFISQMRIWVPGSADAVSVPDTLQLRFQDPESGIVYASKMYGTETIDGKTAQKGPGSRMLQYVDELANQAYLIERDPTTNQVLRNADGTLKYLFDAQGQAQVANPAARTAVRRYVSNLDVMRQLMTYFGYGPIGH